MTDKRQSTQQSADENSESLLQFPCRFPIKAMGRHDEQFTATVTAIVSRHAGPLPEASVHVNQSNNGRFLAVTVTIEAQSRSQLDAIYMDLTAHEAVLMAL